MEELKPGDKLYLPTALYIDSPWRDISGGLAVIRKIDIERGMVNFRGFEGTWYNLKYLLEIQEELAEKFGDKIAYRDI